jgi:hypothetical protein
MISGGAKKNYNVQIKYHFCTKNLDFEQKKI